MCLILVAVEKYPLTDQWHFTSGAHWKGRECETAKAPLSFSFSTKSHTGYWAPVVPKPEPGEWCSCIRPPGQTTVLSHSQHSYHCGGQEGLTIFPVRQIPEDYWWPSRLELKSHYFLSFMSKSNRIQRISLHGVGTWHHTCFCLHWKQATLHSSLMTSQCMVRLQEWDL